MIMKARTKLRWKILHSAKSDIVSVLGTHTWQPGKWHTIKGKLEMCVNGFHCSTQITDAMYYVSGNVLAQVRVRGNNIVRDNDKECWQSMKLVRAWRWTRENYIGLCVYAAEYVLEIYEKEVPASNQARAAIEFAKTGKPDAECAWREAQVRFSDPKGLLSRAATYALAAAEYAPQPRSGYLVRQAYSAAFNALYFKYGPLKCATFKAAIDDFLMKMLQKKQPIYGSNTKPVAGGQNV